MSFVFKATHIKRLKLISSAFVLLLLIGCSAPEKKSKYTIKINLEKRDLVGRIELQERVIPFEASSDSVAYREGVAAFIVEYSGLQKLKKKGINVPHTAKSFVVLNEMGMDIKSNISTQYLSFLDRFMVRELNAE